MPMQCCQRSPHTCTRCPVRVCRVCLQATRDPLSGTQHVRHAALAQEWADIGTLHEVNQLDVTPVHECCWSAQVIGVMHQRMTSTSSMQTDADATAADLVPPVEVRPYDACRHCRMMRESAILGGVMRTIECSNMGAGWARRCDCCRADSQSGAAAAAAGGADFIEQGIDQTCGPAHPSGVAETEVQRCMQPAIDMRSC
jgi:hypothetical protein